MINLNPVIIEEGIFDVEDILINFNVPNTCLENSFRIYHNKQSNLLPQINFTVYYPDLDLEYPIYDINNLNQSYLLNGHNSFIFRIRTGSMDMNLIKDQEFNLHLYIQGTCNIDPNQVIFCIPLQIQTKLELELTLIQPETNTNNNDAKIGIKGNGGKESYVIKLYKIDELNSNNIILIKTFTGVLANELKQVINLTPGLYQAELIDSNNRIETKTLKILPFSSALFSLVGIPKSFACNYTNFYQVSDETINDGFIRFNLNDGFNFTFNFYWNGPFNVQGSDVPSNESSSNLYNNIVNNLIQIGNETYNKGDLINVYKGWYKFTFVYNNNSEVRWIEVKSPPKTIINIISFNPPSIPNGNDANLELNILSFPENNGDYNLTWYENGEEVIFPNPYYDEFDNIDKIRVIKWNNLKGGIYELKVRDCLNKIINNISVNLIDPDILKVSVVSIENSCSCDIIYTGKINLKFEKANLPIKIKIRTEYTETEETIISSILNFPYFYSIEGLDAGVYELEIEDSIDNPIFSQKQIIGGLKIKKPRNIVFESDITSSYCALANGKVILNDISSFCECLPNNDLELYYALKFEWSGIGINDYNRNLKNQNNLVAGSYSVLIQPQNNWVCIPTQTLNIVIEDNTPLLVGFQITDVENYAKDEGSINLFFELSEGVLFEGIKWVFENLNGTNYCPDTIKYKGKTKIDCLYAGRWIGIIKTNYCESRVELDVKEPNKFEVHFVDTLSLIMQDYHCEMGKLAFRVDSLNGTLLNWQIKGYDLQPLKETDINVIEGDKVYSQVIFDTQIYNLSYPYYIIENLRCGMWDVLVEDSSSQEVRFTIEIKPNAYPCYQFGAYSFNLEDFGFYPNPKQYALYEGDYNFKINRFNMPFYCETSSCCEGLDFYLYMDTPIDLSFVFDIDKFNDIKYLKNDKPYLYPVYDHKGKLNIKGVRIDGKIVEDGDDLIIPILSTKCVSLEPNNYANLVLFKVKACIKDEYPNYESTYQSVIYVDEAHCCQINEGENRNYKIELEKITDLSGNEISFLYDENIEGYLEFSFNYLISNTCECCDNLVHIDIFKDEACELTNNILRFGYSQVFKLINSDIEMDLIQNKFKVRFSYTCGNNPNDKWINFKFRTKIKCTGETDWDCEIPLCPYVYDTIEINLLLLSNSGINVEESPKKLTEFNNLTPYLYEDENSGIVILQLDFPIIPASLQVFPMSKSIINKQWVVSTNAYKLLKWDYLELYQDSPILNIETSNSKRTDYFNGSNLFYFYFDNIENGVVPYLKVNELFKNVEIKNDFYIYLSEPLTLDNGPLYVKIDQINQNTKINPDYNGEIQFTIYGGTPPYYVKLVNTFNSDLNNKKISLPYNKETIQFNDEFAVMRGDNTLIFDEVVGSPMGTNVILSNLKGNVWNGLDYENVFNNKWTQIEDETRYTLIVWDSSDLDIDLGARLSMGSEGRLYNVTPYIELWDLSSYININGFKGGMQENVGITCGSYNKNGSSKGKTRIDIFKIPSNAFDLKLVITNNNITTTLDTNNMSIDMCNLNTSQILGSDLNDFKINFGLNTYNYIIKNTNINQWVSENDFVYLNKFSFDLDNLMMCDCDGYYKVEFSYKVGIEDFYLTAKFRICEMDYFAINKLTYDKWNNTLIIDFSNSKLIDLIINNDLVGLNIFIKNNEINWSKLYTLSFSKNNPIVKLEGVKWDGQYFIDVSISSIAYKINPNISKTLLCKTDYKDNIQINFNLLNGELN